jgi:hypothetical protein
VDRRLRRGILNGIGVVAVIAALAAVVIANRDPGPLEERYARSERAEVGAVIEDDGARAAVLSVARLDGDAYGLHLVLMANDLVPGEAVTAGSVAQSGSTSMLADGTCLEVALTESGAATEMWILSPLGTRRLIVEVVASSSAGREGAGAEAVLFEGIGPPASETLNEEVPPCELKVLARGERGETRPVGELDIDLQELGVDPRLWSTK